MERLRNVERQAGMTREDMKLVEALKYWCDTNTECGVTHIPSSLLLKAIEALRNRQFEKRGEQE